MHETARVLRAVCRAQHCPGDPAADLAAVVRARHNGPELDDTLVAISVGAPDFPGVLRALREARQGHRSAWTGCPRRPPRAARARAGPQPGPARGDRVRRPAHAVGRPGGTDGRPAGGAAPRGGGRRTPAPYDRATVVGNGLIQTCLRWPADTGPPAAVLGRPAAGADAAARRRSRPLHAAALGARAGRAYAQRKARHRQGLGPFGAGARRPNGEGRRAVQAFLLGDS